MNWLLLKIIMNSQYRHTHKEIKTSPQTRSKLRDALYRTMMQYGINMSTKHPSEINKKFENSFLKFNHFLMKIKLFTIFQLRL